MEQQKKLKLKLMAVMHGIGKSISGRSKKKKKAEDNFHISLFLILSRTFIWTAG